MRKLILLSLLALCSVAMHARDFNPVLWTEADYAKITYNWTDKDGVSHTSNVAQKAESTEQIMALIKEVYGNPEIPGNYYALPHTGEGEVPYNDNSNYGAIGHKPNKEGYTMLVVAIHDDWVKSNFVDGKFKHGPYSKKTYIYRFINEAIKWVKVIPNGVYLKQDTEGPNNSGVIFNVDETLNRFYFMTKGKARATNNNPFNRMFELFSPTTNVGGDVVTKDFYDKMMAGATYNVLHDCGTIEELEHYFALKGKSGTDSQQLTGLVFFIPDYRYQYWSGRNASGYEWTWYNQSYAPRTLMYTIKLQARAERAVTDDNSRKYNVTLDWTSSLGNIATGTNLEEEFDIYRVVNGVRETTPIATGVKGNTYTYQVPQELKGYDITYVISGRPTGTEFNKAWSNDASVTIPGYDPFERLNLSIVGNYKSTYDQALEQNNYENLITVTNNTADATTALKGNMIDNNTKFKLYRLDTERDGAPLELIATVEMGNKKQKQEDGKWLFPYTVTYESQVKGVEYPATSGNFTSDSEDGVLNLGENGLPLMDAFSASTRENKHPDHYDYQVTFVSAIDIEAADGKTSRNAYSNVTRVPVYKTEATVGVPTYTRSEVIGDTDHTLDLGTAATIDVLVRDYSNVKQYVVRRDAKENVSVIQRNQNGSYTSFKKDKSGLNTKIEDCDFAEGSNVMTMKAEDAGRDVTTATSTSYVAVIEAYTQNTLDNTVISTYGSPIKQVEMANVELGFTSSSNPEVSETMGYVATDPIKFSATETKSAYFVNLDLTAWVSDVLKIAGDGEAVPNYRIWRTEGGKETQVVGDTVVMHRDDLEKDFEYGYRQLFTDNANKRLLVQDAFKGTPLAEGVHNQVTYLVRLYAEAAAGKANVRRTDDTQAEARNYYVAQNEVTLTFAKGIHTGVVSIDAARTPVKVTYYNTMGHASSTPWSGINIIVTRYSDGSTASTRQLK